MKDVPAEMVLAELPEDISRIDVRASSGGAKQGVTVWLPVRLDRGPGY